jgi:hypothetical protein
MALAETGVDSRRYVAMAEGIICLSACIGFNLDLRPFFIFPRPYHVVRDIAISQELQLKNTVDASAQKCHYCRMFFGPARFS